MDVRYSTTIGGTLFRVDMVDGLIGAISLLARSGRYYSIDSFIMA